LKTNHTKIRWEQWIPVALPEVFSFFSDAQNLEKVTPPWVGFRILTPLPIQMAVGTLIDYEVKLRGIPMHWRSEITEWDPPRSFADRQLKGPYAFWLHTHSFAEKDNGTLVTDDVEYAPPLSWVPGASLVNRWFVRPELNRIFEHRKAALRSHFGLPPEQSS